jgi:hypothetical protein
LLQQDAFFLKKVFFAPQRYVKTKYKPKKIRQFFGVSVLITTFATAFTFSSKAYGGALSRA